jgi:hypothetical protein
MPEPLYGEPIAARVAWELAESFRFLSLQRERQVMAHLSRPSPRPRRPSFMAYCGRNLAGRTMMPSRAVLSSVISKMPYKHA